MKKLVTLVVAVFLIQFIWAQEELLTKVLPPSPNAASLGQYADIPVSKYTGVPQISVPLYTIKSGDIELPISLSYHASGIKVAQEASWVGLGWSLNAGGAITRQVRGIDDFGYYPENGYVNTPFLPDYDDTNDHFHTPSGWDPLSYYSSELEARDPVAYEVYRRILVGTYDGEPDIYYYNFLGYSGKMAFKKGQQSSSGFVEATPLSQNNMKFRYNPSTKVWEVIDGNGWRFYFGTVETSISHSSSGETNTILDFEYIDPSNTPGQSDYVSAWYIDSIVTPNGDKITFQYDNQTHETISQVSYNQINSYVHHPGNIDGSIAPNRYTASMQQVEDVYLEQINFNNGYITFTRENREDMRKLDAASLTPQRLASFEVFDNSATSIKKVDFLYDYFLSPNSSATNPENYKRLRLEAVQESFWDGTSAYTSNPPHVFTYDGTPLPKKTSTLTDYWGYTNSVASNNAQITYKSFTTIDVSSHLDSGTQPLRVSEEQETSEVTTVSQVSDPANGVFVNGVSREVDPNRIQAGILKSIAYPTGGVSKFSFEPNDYYNQGSEYNNTSFNVTDYYNTTDPNQKTESFTLTENTYVSLEFWLFNSAHNGEGPSYTAAYDGINAVLRKADGKEILYYLPSEYMEEFNANYSVLLPPGDYEIELDNGDKEHIWMDLNASYLQQTAVNKKLGGGLRVSSIVTEDANNEILRTDYSYESSNGNSSGRLLTPIKTYYIDLKLFAYSGTVIPLGSSAQGSPVGYDVVTVSKKDKQGNSLGTIVSTYENVEDWINYNYQLSGESLPGVPTNNNLGNGQLLSEIVRNGAGQEVKSTTYGYALHDSPAYQQQYKFEGMVVIHNPYLMPNAPQTGGDNRTQFYYLKTEWRHPTGKIETVYDENGQNPVTTGYTYNYDDYGHKNMTSSEIIDSKGDTMITSMEYPSDYPSGTRMATSVFDDMVLDNVVNPIIKQESTLNGSKIQGSINNFRIETHTNAQSEQNNMYLPDSLDVLKRGTLSDYETRAIYHKYDNYGNPLEVSRSDGTKTSYIWGYNLEYPVAKIDNATREDIAALSEFTLDFHSGTGGLTAAQETALRSLPGTLVTTYTYDPLVGVTTVTDPRGYTTKYDYDDQNRLEEIRDEDDNILTDYEYHYRGSN